MTMEPPDAARHGSGAGLGYGDVAAIADEAAAHELRFVDAHTVEPYSDFWILRLRAPDGTLYRVDSWPGWRAVQEALQPARPPPRRAEPA